MPQTDQRVHCERQIEVVTPRYSQSPEHSDDDISDGAESEGQKKAD